MVAFAEQLVEKAMENQEFRTALLKDPHAAIRQEIGLDLPENINITFLEEKPGQHYIVIPAAPRFPEFELADDALETFVGLAASEGGTCNAHCTMTSCGGCT